MTQSVIDGRALRRTLWTSWGYTSLAFLNLLLIAFVVGFLSTRFGGPRLFIGTMVPLGAVALVMFVFSENVVNIMLQARIPDTSNPLHARFTDTLTRVSKKAGLWVEPRAYIVKFKDMPNAVAYGMGFPFFRAVAVTEELIELMSPEELEAVVAHEIGHLRSKDVGILSLVGITLQMLDRAFSILLRGRSVFGGGPFAYIFGYIIKIIARGVFSLMRFAISQEREYAADALAAETQETPDHMISALRKLKASRTKQGALFDDESDTRSENPIEDLMVSHPGIKDRIASLTNLIKKE